MQGKMKQVIMEDIGKLKIIQSDIPSIKPDEVLVKVEYVGICGSDLHYFEHGAIGDYIVKPPFVLGHEAGGTVVEAGAAVTHLKAGDRVAMEPGKTCGHCEFCKEGKYNLCPDVIFFATPPVDGTFQEYVAHEADLCFKLPDNVDTMEGALIEPLSVGFHAAMQGDARIGQSAVVFGAGCIGLVSLLALKAMGAAEVYVVDVLDKRLNMAMKLGATGVINGSQVNAVEKIKEIFGTRGVDLAIETSGAEKAAQQSVDMVKKGGTIVMVGYSATGMVTLPMSNLLNKEITIKTVFRYRHIYPLAIKAVAEGKINIKQIVSNTFGIDDVQEAMEFCIKNKADVTKGVIKF